MSEADSEYATFDAILAKLPGSSPTPKQRASLFDAFKLSTPAKFAKLVAESTTGNVPIALLTSKVDRGEHLAREPKANKLAKRDVCKDCGITLGKGHAVGCEFATGEAA